MKILSFVLFFDDIFPLSWDGEKVRKDAFACSVEKSRNRKPSPQALFINTIDHLEKKFEKVPTQSHIFSSLVFLGFTSFRFSLNLLLSVFITELRNCCPSNL